MASGLDTGAVVGNGCGFSQTGGYRSSMRWAGGEYKDFEKGCATRMSE